MIRGLVARLQLLRDWILRWAWPLMALVVIFVVGWALLAPPNTLIAARLDTEVLELRVANPHAMRITLREARLGFDGPCLKDLVIEPRRGAVVRYVREMRRALRVEIDGPVAWDADGAAEEAAGATFVVGSTGCGEGQALRLPVAGMARFGDSRFFQDPAAPPLALLEGQLVVYGRALPTLLSMPLPSPHALYPVNEITLPGGSVLGDDPTQAEAAASWFGHVVADLSDDGAPALAVSASTNAMEVPLRLPIANAGEGQASASAEIISLGMMARLAGDPNLRWLYLLVGAVVAVVGSLASLRDGVRRDKGAS